MSAKKIKDKNIKDGAPQFDAFIITEVMWQYNDEYNYRNDDGGSGKPMRVFMNEKRANAECMKLNRKQLMFEDLNGYCEDGSEIENAIESSGLKAQVVKSGGYIDSIKISPSNSDETLQKFMDTCGICFYEVTNIKLDTAMKDKV
jgi:hypothetical protein